MDLQSKVRVRSQHSMPVMGLGTWELTKDTPETIAAALDLGYRMIDTSGDYGTQPGIGEGIKLSGMSRDELYIITKVEEDEDSYEATRRNLGELQLDYADLMLIHRPPEQGFGEELWRGLLKAKDESLAKDIGVSNYSITQIQGLIEATGEIPTVNQIEWSPFGFSEQMLDYCRRNGILIQAYSPLTRGERLNETPIDQIAAKYGKRPAQILIRWNLQLGTVPIVKANREEHLKENLEVFDFELSAQEMNELAALNEHFSALGAALQYIE